MSGSLHVEIQRIATDPDIPPDAVLRDWVVAAIGADVAAEVTIRIVDEAESGRLNAQFRNRDYPTNVLSFPASDDWPDIEGELRPVGDLVVCASVIRREAQTHGTSLDAHWAHIVIHGALHLLGHDHELDQDAQRMEAEERRLLAGFGFGDPYADDGAVE